MDRQLLTILAKIERRLAVIEKLLLKSPGASRMRKQAAFVGASSKKLTVRRYV